MYYTDSHIHLQDYSLAEAAHVIKNAQRNNVHQFVVPSSKPDDWDDVIKTTKRFKNTIGAVGIHPWYAENIDSSALQCLEECLQTHPSLWIGECGIDRIKNPDTQNQKDVFRSQIELANKYKRPLIIHSVKADAEIGEFFDLLPKQTIFHSFTGSLEWGQKIQKAGFYIGINFSFFNKSNANEMLQKLDVGKILLETDAPYQPLKGYVSNTPDNLPVLAAAMAAIYRCSETEIVSLLYNNMKNFMNYKEE